MNEEKEDKSKEKRISCREMESYLNEYTVFRRMMDMNFYEKEYFGNAYIFKESPSLPGGDAYIKGRMFEIRRFVLSLGGCNEKLFLFYHYVHGESVSRCAELMGISRRSAFRLKKRAIAYAAGRYPIFIKRLSEQLGFDGSELR